jgi:membrane-bound metal-dependent hydrolase YbcI (DUF457 family)
MEPVTHALTSLALTRAARERLPRFGTAILIVSGVAPDLDYLSYFAGPGSFLRFHRAVTHSLVGSAALVLLIALVFCCMDRRFAAKKPPLRLAFTAAITFAWLGAGWHLLLDLTSGEAVQWAWPFRVTSSAWDIAANFDLWILILLVAGLLMPGLFRLVSQEIGERKSAGGLGRGAVITLLLLVTYLGARGVLHRSAVDLLSSREYRGRSPVSVGALPEPGSPFQWRGVVFTDTTVEEVNLSLLPGAEFDPDRSQTHFKPQPSPALDAGEQSAIARTFLKYARFPLASVYPLENDVRFELRDLQFARDVMRPANILALVDFDDNLRIKREEFFYATSRSH